LTEAMEETLLKGQPGANRRGGPGEGHAAPPRPD
jgi:hypothetical protein